MSNFINVIEKVDLKLKTKYAAMNEELNPIILLLKEKKISGIQLGEILKQYSLLPAEIVRLLGLAKLKLQVWTAVKDELRRNISEETGSRTDGISHYKILRTALLKELNVDISDAMPLPGTKYFLETVKEKLKEEDKAFVAGIAYGLESSAVPELTVVAKLINSYAELNYLSKPINLDEMKFGSYVNNSANKFSLNNFFIWHLQDFEVGHRKGLVETLEKYLPTSDLSSFEEGFDFLLNLMEVWWGELSRSDLVEFVNKDEIQLSNDLVLA